MTGWKEQRLWTLLTCGASPRTTTANRKTSRCLSKQNWPLAAGWADRKVSKVTTFTEHINRSAPKLQMGRKEIRQRMWFPQIWPEKGGSICNATGEVWDAGSFHWQSHWLLIAKVTWTSSAEQEISQSQKEQQTLTLLHLPSFGRGRQIFLNVWSLSFILSSSLTAAILHLLEFSSTNSGKESKVQEQTKDNNYEMELLHMENVSVVVNMDLREIKSVLLLSDQIFKIKVEQYWHRLTEMLHICLYKWGRG